MAFMVACKDQVTYLVFTLFKITHAINVTCLFAWYHFSKYLPQVGVKYSAGMEVFALKSLLDFLQCCGIKIAVLVTDRSTAVRAMMSKDFPSINHQFDIWLYIN